MMILTILTHIEKGFVIFSKMALKSNPVVSVLRHEIIKHNVFVLFVVVLIFIINCFLWFIVALLTRGCYQPVCVYLT